MKSGNLKDFSLLSTSFLMFFLLLCSNHKNIELKDEIFYIEYGNNISTDISQYLSSNTKQKVIDNTEFNLSNFKSNYPTINQGLRIDVGNKQIIHKDKEYLDVGDYKLYLNYKNKEIKEINFKVVDTTKPIIEKISEKIIIEQNAENVDFKKYFKCTDLSVCTLNIDSSLIDISKTGNYKLSIKANDKSNNEIVEEIEVEIVDLKIAKEKGVTKTFDGVIYQSKELVELINEEKIKKTQKTNINKNNTPVKNNTLDKNTTKKMHYINSKNIIETELNYDTDYDWNPNIKIYRNMIMNNNLGRIYYVDSASFAIADFEILTDISYEKVITIIEMDDKYNPIIKKDEKGEYVQIKNEFINYVKEVIQNKENEYSKHRIIYRNTITNALKKMNLNCSDEEMVYQINNWIINNITYKSTNNVNYWEIFSTNKNKGQCYHYAFLFNDMCRAVGIESEYVTGTANSSKENGSHAWNKVKINNKWYYIDVTWNDSNNPNKYYLSQNLWSTHKIR